MFVFRSHSVCQLTIERTLNKNKILTEGTSRHGESYLKVVGGGHYFIKRNLLYPG